MLPMSLIDPFRPCGNVRIALIGNNGGTHFPTQDYGGIEVNVETIAVGLERLGIPFFVVIPKSTALTRSLREPWVRAHWVKAQGGVRREDYSFEIVELDTVGPDFIDDVWMLLHRRKADYDIIWSQSHVSMLAAFFDLWCSLKV